MHVSEYEGEAPAVDAEIEFIVLRVDSTERRFELSQKAATRGLDDTHNRTIQQSIAQQQQTTGFAEAFARAKAKGDKPE
jgi:ribosomal protein S1